jgi:endonuclease YncB( thermonuclease family)
VRRFTRDALLTLVTALLAVCGFLWQSSSGTYIGRASVIDGDIIEIHGKTIRLRGIDAPEGKQTCTDETGAKYRCGRQAALTLDALLLEKTVTCTRVDTDRWGRPVALCQAGGSDVSAEMVEAGHAVAYTQYTKVYLPQEQRAHANRRGMWRGTFELPWDYRARTAQERILAGIAPKPATPDEPECCKVCTKGVSCGDSCIAETDFFHAGDGCAC